MALPAVRWHHERGQRPPSTSRICETCGRSSVDNLHAAGIKITPVITVINGINNDKVGRDRRLLHEQPRQARRPGFSAGVLHRSRRGDPATSRGLAQRYTTSHLAHDLAKYYDGKIDPVRDWFPLGNGWLPVPPWATISADADQEFGQLSCSCHPNCGAAALLARNSEDGRSWAPVSAFFDIEQFMKDVRRDPSTSTRGRRVSLAQVALSLIRNFDESKAPSGLTIPRSHRAGHDGRMGGQEGPCVRRWHRHSSWEFMWIARRCGSRICGPTTSGATCRCAMASRTRTQEGEISFCAYNTGVGWRQICREHAQGRHDQGVVRREGSPRDLRGRSADELQRQDAARAPHRVGRGRDARDRGRPGLGRGFGPVRLRELRERLARRRDSFVPKLGATSCLPRRASSRSPSATCAGNQAAADRSW